MCPSWYFFIAWTVSTHTIITLTPLLYAAWLCRHSLQLRQPCYFVLAVCVDACTKYVNLVSTCSSTTSTHLMNASTCLQNISFLIKNNPAKVINQSTQNIILEWSWLIEGHHQNQRSNNLSLFDDGNYKSWYQDIHSCTIIIVRQKFSKFSFKIAKHHYNYHREYIWCMNAWKTSYMTSFDSSPPLSSVKRGKKIKLVSSELRFSVEYK